MGLLSAIKSALGLDESPDRSGGTEVTVERETDATSERSVKESGPDATGTTGTAEAESGSAGTESPDTQEDDEPVEEVKGIGPTYADRLHEAGVHTVPDLAAADAADLSDATGIGEGRLEKWIERAKAR